MKKTILFDLDGTLTDSGEGIINCVIYALERFGLPIPERESLRYFVGPPLHESFVKQGVPADRAEEAVAVYREPSLAQLRLKRRRALSRDSFSLTRISDISFPSLRWHPALSRMRSGLVSPS